MPRPANMTPETPEEALKSATSVINGLVGVAKETMPVSDKRLAPARRWIERNTSAKSPARRHFRVVATPTNGVPKDPRVLDLTELASNGKVRKERRRTKA